MLSSLTPYQIAHITAWLSCSGLAIAVNRRQGIGTATTLAVCAICVPTSVCAARVLDAVEYWSAYTSLGDRLARGGSSIYGALFVSFAVASAYVRWRGVSALRFLDGAAPALALGEAVSRVGCFLQGCCYGVPLGPRLATIVRGTDAIFRHDQPPGYTLVHPVQLYSTVAASVITIWLLVVFRRRRFAGQVFFTFLLLYGILRLAVAPLRAEALASMKVFSLLFVLTGAIGIGCDASWKRQSVDVEGLGVRS